MSKATTYTVTVPQDKARLRLDRFLADALPELSRSRLKGLIESGQVKRDGVRAGYVPPTTKPGEVYPVHAPAPRPATPRPPAIPLKPVLNDGHLILIAKPAALS